MSDVKLAAFGAVIATVVAITPAPPVILGAPLPLLLAAFAGALFSLAQTPPAKWGSLVALPKGLKGWTKALAIVGRGAGIMLAVTGVAFASAWIVALSPVFWDKLKDAPLAAGAGILAFAFQKIVPRGFDAIGKRIDAFGGKTPPAEEPGNE